MKEREGSSSCGKEESVVGTRRVRSVKGSELGKKRRNGPQIQLSRSIKGGSRSWNAGRSGGGSRVTCF